MLLASLVALLFVGAALATVEVTAEAQGMLRAPKGLRPVASVLGGSLSEVLVQSGDQVQTGQVVARLVQCGAIRTNQENFHGLHHDRTRTGHRQS